MNNYQEKEPLVNWPNLIIGLLIAILLAVVIWFVFDIHTLYKQGAVGHAVSRIHRRAASRPVLVPSQIEGWMTFRYIEFAFHLPPNYLASKLTITDSGFLNITLNKYAAEHKLNTSTFIKQTQTAVASYQVTQP